ncbi:myoneurin [Stegastes partitus]|uniref:Myoneurin n=1 Tax=Stegastes partitus TaxID=144197 RepID=A0A3B5BAK1_9TELE|nr:PREDICTED: myoneurin [Stegastes partitus]XP_008277275.1 PREDICTED: myoneurin [Stegastes partitus]
MAYVTNHGKLLLQRLHVQREMDFLCDITIMVRDVEFRAHRNILAAFSEYFSSQAESADEVTTLDPEKVNRYSLEKLLEFIYTGQMNLSSTRQAAVRRAAVFLGMPEATKYLEDLPRLSEPGETSGLKDDKEAGLSTPSPASPSSPSSPLPLSIVSIAGDWQESKREGKEQDSKAREAGGDDEGRSDDEYSPTTPKSAGRGHAKKRGRPRIFKGEDGEPSSSTDATPKVQSYRGRGRRRGRPRGSGRGRGRGTSRGRGRGVSRSENLSVDESDTSVKDFGDNSADWSPSQDDDSPTRKAQLSAGEGRRGRGRGKARGRGRGRGDSRSDDLSVDESDTSVKDFGDNSADWSPSNDDKSLIKKPRLSFGEARRGRGRGKGKGRGRGRGRRRAEEDEDEDMEEGEGEGEGEEGEAGEESELGELSLFCTECNKQFKDVSSLRRHEKIHKGLKPFSCIFCSKTFRQATQLKTHLRIHTGEKPFGCSECDKCFAQKCQLVAHRRMYHGEEKPYACDRCGFKFATSSNYKIHLRLHSGEKPYVCDVCGQAFAQSSTLTYHKRRHTGEKPYQCDLCGMSFSVSSSLIAHARKHTGETPYKCSQLNCDAKFVTSSELKKHMRRLHPEGNNGVQCLLCGNRFASVKNMIKHQEKAHAEEVRQHRERARAVVLLASSHPVAFVQSRLTQTNKGLVSIPEGEPANPEPATPSPKATSASAASSDAATTDSADAAIIQDFKAEPSHTPLTTADQVTFEADQEQTINSDTLHALVEQLRPPPSPAPGLEQIVIIRTVDTAEGNPPQQ